MEKYIKKSIYKIPLNEKKNNFTYNKDLIEKQYNFFLDNIDEDIKHLESLSEGNDNLNRYYNVRPYSFNLININKKNYINASSINILKKNYFIATQGPLDKTIENFWTMIDENECRVIIMLCNEKENGKEKCAKYWDKGILMNNYRIAIQNKTQKGKYIIREIKLINLSLKKEKIVYQIHFIAWPDHGVPKIEEGKIFNVFVEMINKVDKYKEDNPIVVHCSAGVGRTGTFISMYFLYKEIITQIKNNEEEIQFNIFNLVRKLKEMRILSVQTCIQYEFIYFFVSYLLEKYNK